MGGDRSLVMFSGLLAAALIFSAQELRATVVGLVLWFGLLHALRLMAKSDPKMRSVYLRHRKYKPYYPARSTPFGDPQKWWERWRGWFYGLTWLGNRGKQ